MRIVECRHIASLWRKPCMRCQETVNGEEPHEGEMPRHSFGQAKADVKCGIERLRKEFEQRERADADPIHVIGPVNQKAAPDHHRQDRKVDPVKTPNRQCMPGLEFLHTSISSRTYPGIACEGYPPSADR